MALNGDALGLAIKAAVEAAVASSPTDRTAMFKAIGNAIVTHITTSGQVIVASVSGVTTGISSSGAGTGTIT